jgi:hypothetical protein
MKSIRLTIAAGALALAPVVASAQHTAPGAPVMQGQQQHPQTTVAPQGSAPTTGSIGTPQQQMQQMQQMQVQVSELQQRRVTSEFGRDVGVVQDVVQGQGASLYVLVMLTEGRQVVYPVELMGVHQDHLVVQGDENEIMRAATVDAQSPGQFVAVQPQRSVELPQVDLRRQ